MLHFNTELLRLISEHFSWHPARRMCLAQLIMSLFCCSHVNFSLLAQCFDGFAQHSSCVKRIQRFFKEQDICWICVAKLIFRILGTQTAYVFAIDRTNWKFGKIHKNYLVLSVIYRGQAIPILLKDLGCAGNSSTADRQGLLQKFITEFGSETISCLLGDREFIGKEWFHWLEAHQIPFCIRVKNNLQVRHRNGGTMKVAHKIHHLKPGEVLVWEEKLFGLPVKMAGLKQDNGEYVIVAASLSVNIELLPLYKKRWSIECLFKNIKSNGFRLEDSHIRHAERGEKLFSVIAIATAMAVKVGTENDSPRLRRYKKTKQSFELSLFSLGRRIITNFIRKNRGGKKKRKKIVKDQEITPFQKSVLW